MTKKQANNALFLIAFFAFITTISNVFTLPYFWGFLMHCKICLLQSLIGILLTVLLVISPFVKENKFLLGVPIIALIGRSYYHSITALYSFFNGTAVLLPVGIIPGIFTNASYFLMDTTGLVVLILRGISYLKDKHKGLNVSF